MVRGREWELNLTAHGNGIGNGNELMGMEGNGNVASHSRTSLVVIVLSSVVIALRRHFVNKEENIVVM